MLVIRLILTIFAGSDSIPNIIVSVLFMAGLWRMFEKSGLQGWWALIPGAREYQLVHPTSPPTCSTRRFCAWRRPS